MTNENDFEYATITTNEYGEPTPRPQPKVLAATTGAGVGAALSTIGVYAFEALSGIDLPSVIEGAILVLVSAAVAFAAGYVKAPSIRAS